MKKLLAIMMCIIMLFSMASCNKADKPSEQDNAQQGDVNTPEDTTENQPPEPTAAEIYEAAADKIRALDTVSLEIEISREMKLANDVYNETDIQSVLLKGLSAESFSAKIDHEMSWRTGGTIDYSEVYTGGSLFNTFEGKNFVTDVTEMDYKSSLIPAVMLDSSIYGTVEEMSDGNISFSEPTGAESWFETENGEFIDSNGTAVFNSNGELIESIYEITYTNGPAEIKETVSVSIQAQQDDIVVEAPASAEDCVKLEDPDGVETLIRASYIWTAAQSLDVIENGTYYTEAAAALMTTMAEVSYFGTFADIIGQVDQTVHLLDYNYGEDNFTREEKFLDGKCYTSDNGAEPVQNPGITSQNFREYCIETSSDFVPVIENFESVTVSDLGNLYYIEYSYDDEYSKSIEDDINDTLFADPDFLDNLASDYRTDTAKGYIGIDKFTGLPTALSITYKGYHTIDGTEWSLDFEATKSIYAASLSSYEKITESPYSSGEISEQPTPLFYHVTGEDGQEMWLLGTIHVGDERTANLPQEIKDAFDASDAYALEINSEAFLDQFDDDPELAAQVLQAYLYTDGTTAKDHITDSKLYEDAEKLMKAAGAYNVSVPLMKPNIWAVSLENFMLQQGYEFCSEYGIESRLEHWAEESDKELIEVESPFDQILMLTEFSDELQEMLLSEAVYRDVSEYSAELKELFELWCSGDEAAIKDYLKQDTSDLAPEELELYEEYRYAMETERNIGMLEVAIDFLESGDVMFYAVGLAHLMAEDGLVNTLRDAGYTVELISFS